MGTTNTISLWRYLPLVVLATLLVAGLPVLAVWALDLSGAVDSPILLAGLGFVAALALARGGRALWEARPASKDILFNELMIWGWLRRFRVERRLSNAVELLGLAAGAQQGEIPRRGPDDQAQLLENLAEALEARDPYLHGHSRRVARHASMLTKKMGLPTQQVAMIRTAAAVHDVGKLETPIEVLHKPDRLTDEEFEIIKLHSTTGERLVSPIFGAELASIVAHHHERLDGTGYPAGLAGDEIPLGARIIAVADTFDAITSTRPYRSAKPHKLALDILEKEAGRQLDPEAVKAFCKCYSGFQPLAVWAGISTVPQRLIYPPFGNLPAAGGAAAKVMAATAATAAVGGAAIAHSDLSDSLQTMLSTRESAVRAAVVGPSLEDLRAPERQGARLQPSPSPNPTRGGERDGERPKSASPGVPAAPSPSSQPVPSALAPVAPTPAASTDPLPSPPATADQNPDRGTGGNGEGGNQAQGHGNGQDQPGGNGQGQGNGGGNGQDQGGDQGNGQGSPDVEVGPGTGGNSDPASPNGETGPGAGGTGGGGPSGTGNETAPGQGGAGGNGQSQGGGNGQGQGNGQG